MPLRLTLYFPCCNQEHQLKRFINHYNSSEFFDKKIHELVQFVIIDDGSMREPIQLSSFANSFYTYKIHRINRDVPWNMPEANNLAFEIAETNHLLRTDIDHFFPIETLIYILENHI